MKLPFRERLRMAWELTWPMTLIDVAVVLILHGLLDVPGETADSIWAVAVFFVVMPWVVRRALRRKYANRRVEPRLTYQQSLKVMWLLQWRTLALSLAALVPLSLTLRALHFNFNVSEQSALANNLGLSAADFVSGIAFTPFLIPAMLRKRYRGFHLELIEEPQLPSMHRLKKVHRKL